MDKKAFTLVELIATVTILGVILLIAVPSYNRYIEKSKQTKCKADKNAIIDEIKTYINDCIYNNSCKGEISLLVSDGTELEISIENLISEAVLSGKYSDYNDKKIKIKAENSNGITNYTVTAENMCS